MTAKAYRRIEWRLPILMAERGIRTAAELHRQLVELGIDISRDWVNRLVNQQPERLNLELLAGLMAVLDCGVSDLLHLLPPGQGPRHSAPTRQPTAKERPHAPKPKASIPSPRAKQPEPASGLDSLVTDMLNTKVHPIPVKKRNKD